MGSSSRFDYSVIGDSVNVASRVEAASKHLGFDIVVSDKTAEGLSSLAILEAGTIALKGKSDLVPVHIVVGDEDIAGLAAFTRLANAHKNLIASLREGAIGWEGRLLTCKDLARAVLPELTEFYDAIPGRLDDFPEDRQASVVAIAN